MDLDPYRFLTSAMARRERSRAAREPIARRCGQNVRIVLRLALATYRPWIMKTAESKPVDFDPLVRAPVGHDRPTPRYPVVGALRVEAILQLKRATGRRFPFTSPLESDNAKTHLVSSLKVSFGIAR